MVTRNSNLYLLTRLSMALGVVLLAVGVLVFGSSSSAHAASCGDVQLGGSSWAGGQGVDSHSNAPYEADIYGNSCLGNNNYLWNLNPTPPTQARWGLGWQCVEMASRMYQAHGWGFPSALYAKDIYTNAASAGFTATGQGAIVLSSIVPGDMLVTNEGTAGHVMMVDSVNTANNTISAVDQNGGDNGRTTVTYNPSTKNISDGSYYQFSGVVHSPSDHLGVSAPASITRNGNTMTVFYNDGSGHLKAWYWDVNAHPSWWSGSWNDNITGRPAAIARDDGNMDVFYRTTDNRLRHIAWNVAVGWYSPETLVSSDDVGDPAVAARDSGHMSVFYRTAAGEIKFVSWDSSTGWNLNPQRIYTSNATGDPAAVSRSASTYDVFFVKNNGNLVHLPWDSCCGWSSEDWTANMVGVASAIARNSGGHMSAFYRESNGNVAERFWDVSSGWGVQDWSAQLVGNPNAVVLDNGDVEVYYRETGGNMVDRYWSSVNGWGSTWITGTGTSTSDPWGIRRATSSPNLEVHYWNGSNLQDTNWSFGYPWTTTTITSTP